jgi:hypothetical protein
MAETLVKFDEPITDARGAKYFAQAMGLGRDDGMWVGWLEFLPVDENSESLRSGRETTQPSRDTLVYWADGLSRVYLGGALERAQKSSPPPENQTDAPLEGR